MKSIDACENGRWTVLTWNKVDGSEMKAVPFRCKSWRHEGTCREWCGACDFLRVQQAISEHSHWTYLVLTYPDHHFANITELFLTGGAWWSKLRKRLQVAFGPFKYIQTWEVHKDWYPHVNVLISNEKLYQLALNERWEVKEEVIQPMAKACGFGIVLGVDPMRSQDGMAAYLSKLAMELTGGVTKKQVPVNAPRHFRRLRASVRLLPKRIKSETITGLLHCLPAKVLAKYLGLNVPEGGES